MIFKKRKIEKLTSSHNDVLANLKAEHQKEVKEITSKYMATKLKIEKDWEKTLEEVAVLHSKQLENNKSLYRTKLEQWQIEADIHLDKEIANYSKKLKKEESLKIAEEKKKLKIDNKKEIDKFLKMFEQEKINEQKKLEKKYKESEVLKTKLKKYFSEELGREYQDISFNELEENLKNELQELVNEIDVLSNEIDAKKDKILQFNELAKEMNYLEEEIGIKRNELYEIKQAIRELKKGNN